MRNQRVGLPNVFLTCFLALVLLPAIASSGTLKDLDLEGNGTVDLADAVVALKILSGDKVVQMNRPACSDPVGLKTLVFVLQTIVCHEIDDYEYDATFRQANPMGLEEVQHHTFHDASDADWVMFYGKKGESYTIEIKNPEERCDPGIELYSISAEGQPQLLASVSGRGFGRSQALDWGNPDDWEELEDGLLFVRITNSDEDVFGKDTGYDLSVYFNDAPPPLGAIVGFVCDANIVMTEAIQDVTITIRKEHEDEEDGNPVYYNNIIGIYYAFGLDPATYVLTVNAEGYEEVSVTVQVESRLVGRDICFQ